MLRLTLYSSKQSQPIVTGAPVATNEERIQGFQNTKTRECCYRRMLLDVSKRPPHVPSLTAGLSPRIIGYSRMHILSKYTFFKQKSSLSLSVFDSVISFKGFFRFIIDRTDDAITTMVLMMSMNCFSSTIIVAQLHTGDENHRPTIGRHLFLVQYRSSRFYMFLLDGIERDGIRISFGTMNK